MLGGMPEMGGYLPLPHQVFHKRKTPLQASTKESRGNSIAELFPSTAIRRMTCFSFKSGNHVLMGGAVQWEVQYTVSVLEIGTAWAPDSVCKWFWSLDRMYENPGLNRQLTFFLLVLQVVFGDKDTEMLTDA